MTQKFIRVRVRDSQNVLFEDDVDRISSYNEEGRFDVYPMHINFISIIRREIQLFRSGQKLKEIKIEQAIMKVKKDAVTIFLGIEAFVLESDAAVRVVKKEDGGPDRI